MHFVITRLISDQIALHSVQLPLLNYYDIKQHADFKNFDNSTKCLIVYLQFIICMYKHFRSIFNRDVNW